MSMPFGPDEREAPRYSPDELKQYLPGYTMERAIELVQTFAATYDADYVAAAPGRLRAAGLP